MAQARSIDHVQIAMPRGEEHAARAFYGGLLGLAEIPKPANLVARGGLWFDCGGLQVHLGVEDDFRPARKAHVAYVVDDLAAIGLALARAGRAVVKDVEQVAGSVRLFTDDPFGNRVELMQRTGAPASGG